MLIPGCALLLPVVAMNTLIAPRLLKAQMARHVWPASAALTAICCTVITPLVGALVPPVVPGGKLTLGAMTGGAVLVIGLEVAEKFGLLVT